MSSKQVKKAITIYLTEDEIVAYKEACEVQGRNMASQGRLLVKKFTLNNKRKAQIMKLVYGVGINDTSYNIRPTVNGKKVMRPSYRKWLDMLGRCYSDKVQERQPTYIGCSVTKEWLTFSVFATWFKENYVEGYSLDKDIKSKGNKVYGPEMCIFTPKCINNLLTDHRAARGAYPQGVYLHKPTNKFVAKISIDSKVNHLGYFATPELASKAYIKAKNNEIKRKCAQYPEFAGHLMQHLLPTK